MVKKLIVCVFAVLIMTGTAVFAENNVSQIDIEVSILENSDARVVQKWYGTFDDSTENYIVIGNLDGIKIKDFTVSDENGMYQYVSDWDIDASRRQKSGKCGIVSYKDGKYELCWGIGEYGYREYTVSYTLTDFVASYKDRDGFNFMFVNPEMSTFPTDVKFRLFLDNGTMLGDQNADIWAFGFDGNINFSDGNIVATTYSPLRDDNYFVIMASFDKGVVSPSRQYDYSFEKVRKKAFNGSDYSDDSEGMWLVFAFLGLMGAGFISFVVYTIKLSSERKKFVKNTNYFRGTANGGHLCISYYLSQKFGVGGKDGSIIGAYIMQMMNDGNISCDTRKETGFFGREKESREITLVTRPENKHMAKLYDIMLSASGRDGILQEKELEKHCASNYKILRSFIDNEKDRGETLFCEMHGFKTGISNRIKNLSELGQKQLAELVGMKKYLEEFSLIGERSASEIAIWKDYLVYATLLGIADKVIEQLKTVYPDNIPQIEEYSARVNMTGYYYSSMYRSMITAEQKMRSQGSGGRASFGGGGGFSGGGIGGGSR